MKLKSLAYLAWLFRAQWESRPEPIADLLTGQEKNIREEWLSDLQTGRLDRHALDSYFAGRIDQHNTLIGMAVEAHPHLRETLPPPIQYGQIRDDLQQQLAQQQTERNNSLAAEQSCIVGAAAVRRSG